MVERCPYKAVVVGSNPTIPIWEHRLVWLGQSPDTGKVIGSNPIAPTLFINSLVYIYLYGKGCIKDSRLTCLYNGRP